MYILIDYLKKESTKGETKNKEKKTRIYLYYSINNSY